MHFILNVNSFFIKNIIVKNNYLKNIILIDNTNEIEKPIWDSGEIVWDFDDDDFFTNKYNDTKTLSINFTKSSTPISFPIL